jgi:hypothetical protein
MLLSITSIIFTAISRCSLSTSPVCTLYLPSHGASPPFADPILRAQSVDATKAAILGAPPMFELGRMSQRSI